MNTRAPTGRRILATLLLLVATGPAAAALQTANVLNTTTMNYGFFFANDTSEIELTNLQLLGTLNGWTEEVASATNYVFSSGDPATTARRFTGLSRIEFDYKVPVVSFEYAEVLFDGVNHTVGSTRTYTFDSTARGRGRWSGTTGLSIANTQYIDNYFGGGGATAVPLPNSVVLLLSAVAFMGFSRRNDDAEPALAAA